MNIFFLDRNPRLAAQYHCDRHIVKMCTEYGQIICTSLHVKVNMELDRIASVEDHLEICSTCRELAILGKMDFNKYRDHLLDFKNNIPYMVTHKNHPCCKWSYSGSDNFIWLLLLFIETLKEYTNRYKKQHASSKVHRFMGTWNLFINELWNSNPHEGDNIHLKQLRIGKLMMDYPPQVMPEEFRMSDREYIVAYRNYYNRDKSRFAKWNYSETPDWFENLYDGPRKKISDNGRNG